jgi:HPr kinase/phosphorylase
MKIIHGTCIELDGKALLIQGRSNSGKSTLGLRLIALGGKLIADDRTKIFVKSNKVFVSAPETLPLAIEARGIGILNAPVCLEAPLAVVVNLSRTETTRLPDQARKKINILGYSFPFYYLRGMIDPAAVLYVVLKFGVAKL